MSVLVLLLHVGLFAWWLGPCLGLSTEQSLNVQQLYLPRRDRSFPRIFVLLLSRQGERARENPLLGL